jgi:hypothetical protein
VFEGVVLVAEAFIGAPVHALGPPQPDPALVAVVTPLAL